MDIENQNNIQQNQVEPVSQQAQAPIPEQKIKAKSDKAVYLYIAGLIAVVFILLCVGGIMGYKYLRDMSRSYLTNKAITQTQTTKEEQEKPSAKTPSAPQETEPKAETPETPPAETPPQASTPAPTPPAPAKPECHRYNIREGKFKSDNCYSAQDYSDLIYYIGRYNDAVFDYNGAAGQANVTCQGFTESFEQLCEQSKEDMEDAEDDMDEYEDKVNEIIAKGTPYND